MVTRGSPPNAFGADTEWRFPVIIGRGSPGFMKRGTCRTGDGNASSRRGGAGDRRLWVSVPHDRRELIARSGGDEALAGGGRPGVIGQGGEVPEECQPWNRRPSGSDDALPAGVAL